MGEIYYNTEGVIYNNDKEIIHEPSIPWYVVDSNTVRYYPLTNTTDYSAYGADLTNSGITFDKGYAEWVVDGTPKMLQDKTINLTQLSSDYTIFCWEKLYTGSSTYQDTWYLDKLPSIVHYQLLDHRNNSETRVRTWVTSGQDIIDPTVITPDTWFWTCVVQYFGSYRELWVGNAAGEITYTGITITPDADPILDFNVLTLGNKKNGTYTNRREGAISGLIIKKGRWFEADILAQAAKGPYYNYT